MSNQSSQFRRPLTVVVFVAITVPLMRFPAGMHTAQLLLQITSIKPDWLAYAYAGFFALGFDLAVFMFSLYDLRGAKKTFAVMAGVVGFFFFNLEILFERLPSDGWANGRLWASVVLGTMFAVVGAYLVYHSTELINQVFADRRAVGRANGQEPAAQSDRRLRELRYKHTPAPPGGPPPSKAGGPASTPVMPDRDRRVHRGRGVDPLAAAARPEEKILLLKQEGKTNAEIGRQLGISDKTVYRRLKKMEA